MSVLQQNLHSLYDQLLAWKVALKLLAHIHCWNKGWLVVWWFFFFFCIWKTEVKLCYTILQCFYVKDICQKASAVKNGCFTRCKETEAPDQHTNLCPHPSCYAFLWQHTDKIPPTAPLGRQAGRWKGICAALCHQSVHPLPVFLFLHQNLSCALLMNATPISPHIWEISSPQEGKKYFPSSFHFCLWKHTHIFTHCCVSIIFSFCKYSRSAFKQNFLHKRKTSRSEKRYPKVL